MILYHFYKIKKNSKEDLCNCKPNLNVLLHCFQHSRGPLRSLWRSDRYISTYGFSDYELTRITNLNQVMIFIQSFYLMFCLCCMLCECMLVCLKKDWNFDLRKNSTTSADCGSTTISIYCEQVWLSGTNGLSEFDIRRPCVVHVIMTTVANKEI